MLEPVLHVLPHLPFCIRPTGWGRGWIADIISHKQWALDSNISEAVNFWLHLKSPAVTSVIINSSAGGGLELYLNYVWCQEKTQDSPSCRGLILAVVLQQNTMKLDLKRTATALYLSWKVMQMES